MLCSSTLYGVYMAWMLGDTQSLLVPGNYDVDGLADPAVYNRTTVLLVDPEVVGGFSP